MKEAGTKPVGLEIGNAWDLRSADNPKTNWIVGSFPTIPVDSLRFMRQTNESEGIVGDTATDVAMKWFVHSPDDDQSWGENKPTSAGRTMSILAGDGELELVFTRDGNTYTLTLDEPGDFAIWGPGLEHSWKPIKLSTVLTLRWKRNGSTEPDRQQ